MHFRLRIVQGLVHEFPPVVLEFVGLSPLPQPRRKKRRFLSLRDHFRAYNQGMDQLGHLLLGLALAGPLLLVIRAMIRAGQKSQFTNGQQFREPAPGPPRCDPKAVAEYFASLLRRPKSDPAQALSPSELTQILRNSGEYVPPLPIRFDAEGGYRLQL
jgi:hypothetical protein